MANCQTCNSAIPNPPPKYCDSCGTELKPIAESQPIAEQFSPPSYTNPVAPQYPSVQANPPENIWDRILKVSFICFLILLGEGSLELYVGADVPDALVAITLLGALYFMGYLFVLLLAIFSNDS